MVAFNRKERDKKLRRSDILRAAEHVFALRGYHKATIRDIAREAQYATGTVYLHFKDKDDLYFALFEEKMKMLLSLLKERVAQEKSPELKFRVFVRETLDFFEKNKDFFRIFVYEGSQIYTEDRISNSITGKQFKEYMIKLVKEAQETRLVSDDLDPGQTGDVFFAILKTVVIECFKAGKGTVLGVSDIIIRYFLKGAGKRVR
ncbi:MAG: TetR/AcrR family transcriptional regulator [Candidatus Omnitrophica bacterium]|nr:TetR/AcrR family transcriptional regulator [Candidatus Omnitrophota bacterium]MDD5501319.1 TetR/AcrR family transcriptional regulator [Candidatus Omnitrophota bacterium]